MTSTVPKYADNRGVSVWTPTSADSDTSSISVPCCRPKPSAAAGVSWSSKTLISKSSPSKVNHFLEDKRLGSLDLFFRDTETVELGDVAHGWVELSLERPALLTSMSIGFYGEVVFELFNQIQTRQFENRKYELWRTGSDENMTMMEPGFYVYEFFVGTHTQLPSPFSGDGAVRALSYFCEVTVVESLHDDHHATNPIEHVKRRILDLKPNGTMATDERLLNESITEKAMMFVKNILDCSGTIVLTATLLDGRQYRPGENIRFRLEVLNCFRKLKLEVALVQRAKACVDDSFVAVELDVIRYKVGKLSSSETYRCFTNLALWIPSPSIAPVHVGLVYANRLVQLGYTFRVTLSTWTNKKMTIEVPLVVRRGQNSVSSPYERNYATL